MLDIQTICNIFWHITLKELADIAVSVTAIINVLLVWYAFIYTKRKDQRDTTRALSIQEQNIRLQWFKELIIQPNFHFVTKFYDEITIELNGLLTPNLTDSQKIAMTDNVKLSQSRLRRSFVNILRVADVNLEVSVITDLDTLIGDITITIYDLGINLSHPPAFEREILNKITASKNNLISLIYGFKGTA